MSYMTWRATQRGKFDNVDEYDESLNCVKQFTFNLEYGSKFVGCCETISNNNTYMKHEHYNYTSISVSF